MKTTLLAGTFALAVITATAGGAMASNENREGMSRGRVAHAGAADMTGLRMHHGAMPRHAGYARRGYVGEGYVGEGGGGAYGAYDAYDSYDAGPGVTIGIGPAPGYGYFPGGCSPEDYGRYGRCNGIGFVGY